jgi:DNA modification methylase
VTRFGPIVVTRGDAADLSLPDATVDTIVTSPPYFGLRSYVDGGEHYAGQVGDEATPGEYLDALTACTREWMRVLKPGGSIWVNLGDKYAGNGTGTGVGLSDGEQMAQGARDGNRRSRPQRVPGIPAKSLMGLPWRYALRCVDDLGLILRAEIVWSKPNGLPESVTDRVRRSHEQVFHFVKQPRYYSAVDEIREQHLRSWGGSPNGGNTYAAMKAPGAKDANLVDAMPNPLGKLPGSVWTIPTAPLRVPEHLGIDHFAAYPPELVRPMVLGWSPREVCTVCGEGRRPTSEALPFHPRAFAAEQQDGGRSWHGGDPAKRALGVPASERQRSITGYACACPDTTAPSTPGVVLDPFGGTGTTALVAAAYGRVGISVDLSADYCRLARWRTSDPGERARAANIDRPKPLPLVEGDAALFDLEGLA